MKVILIKDEINKNFFPQINLINTVENLKKETKKELLKTIIDQPESLKAYRKLAVYECGNFETKAGITNRHEPKKIFSYEEILNEIIEQITKQ